MKKVVYATFEIKVSFSGEQKKIFDEPLSLVRF